MRASSGATGLATTADAAKVLISETALRAAEKGGMACHARITNEGGIAGFVSFDGGNTKHRLPADQTVCTFYDVGRMKSVEAYRIASGTDLTGLFADVWG